MIELDFSKSAVGGRNITIGGYTTHYFDVSQLAAIQFEAMLDGADEEEIKLARQAAMKVDEAFHILKLARQAGKTTTEQYLEFEEIISEAEEILDSIGQVENHNYLRDYHEEEMAALLDENEELDFTDYGDDDEEDEDESEDETSFFDYSGDE